MLQYYREMRAKYERFQQPGEGFVWWYLHREASYGVKQAIAFVILAFYLYLWTNWPLMIGLIEVGAVAGVIVYGIQGYISLRGWLQKRRMEKESANLNE